MTTNASVDMGESNTVHSREKCKLEKPLRKSVWNFLKMLKIDPPQDPKISLFGGAYSKYFTS